VPQRRDLNRGFQVHRHHNSVLFLMLLCTGASVSAAAVHAQCPDGTPPPCPGSRATVRRITVAVLPFENRSRDTAEAFLTDALVDEVISRLGRLERLSVISQTAVRQVSNAANLDVRRLGRTLNAGYLVSGTVQRAGRRMRINAEVVRAASGERIWSDLYDRPASELSAITSDLTAGVAASVLGRLAAQERARLVAPPTRNSAAFELYLRGSRRLFDPTPLALQDAIASLEAALQLDPAFAAAQGRLAQAYSRAVSWDVALPGMRPESVSARGLVEARRALALDSTSADAWGGLGVMLFYSDSPDYGGSLAALRRATLLDSNNAVLHALYGNVIRRFGDYATAEQESRRALALQPDLTQAMIDLATIRLARRQFREALVLLDSSLAINHAQWQHHAVRANIRYAAGDTGGARQAAVETQRLSGRAHWVLPLLRAAAGDTAGARLELDSALRRIISPEGPVSVRQWGWAAALAGTRQPDRALDLLERIRPRGAWLWSYLGTPQFDPIRTDPRFVRLVEEARPPGAPRLP
jgi:TolB-like protein